MKIFSISLFLFKLKSVLKKHIILYLILVPVRLYLKDCRRGKQDFTIITCFDIKYIGNKVNFQAQIKKIYLFS